MAFKKGEGGRPKGTKNKLTLVAKDVIASAAEALGGTKRLVTWAKSDPANERVFWGQIYPRLLPHEVTGKDGGDIAIRTIVNNYVAPPPAARHAPTR